MKLSSVLVAAFAFWGDWASAQFICPICGENSIITIPDGIVDLQNGQAPTCAQLEGAANGGNIPESVCPTINSFAQIPCGCQDLVPTASPAPTDTITAAPTFDPDPPCFKSTTNIFALERSLGGNVGTPRTYILCPNTVFELARQDNTGAYGPGNVPLQPRPNVHIKCGFSGSSKNNCIMRGGSVSLALGNRGGETGVILEGITFESGFNVGIFVASTGSETTFIDCIIREQENAAPFIVLAAQRRRRRLGGNVEESNNDESSLNFYKIFENGGLEDYRNDHADRSLQSSTKITFRQTVFENNRLSRQFLAPGVVTSFVPNVDLVFEDSTFFNNSFADTSRSDRSWLINTPGSLTITNSCFEDNALLGGRAPVLTFGGPAVTASNNFGVPDAGNLCQFIADFPDGDTFELKTNFTCAADFDAATCQAQEPETEADPITMAPTATPAPSADSATTNAPVSQPSGGGTPSGPTDGDGDGDGGGSAGFVAMVPLLSVSISAVIGLTMFW